MLLGDQMRRREFVLLAGAGIALPLAARAQQPAKQHRIALVAGASPVDQFNSVPSFQALFGELRRLGYVEGHNLIVERYSAEGHRERYADIARQVVASTPDVIILPVSQLAPAFLQATNTIPIVSAMGSDPVAEGLVTSLARPGRNLTGVNSESGVEIWGKRLQLLKETIPAASKVAWLSVQINWQNPLNRQLIESSRRLGLSLVGLDAAGGESELQRVFAAASQDRPDAILMSGAGELYQSRQLVVQLAEKYRFPALYPYRVLVEAGGLMAYTSDNAEVFRRLANYAVQILNGAKPTEMPVYQAIKYELVINKKAADAIGLTISPSVLAQADEVIE